MWRSKYGGLEISEMRRLRQLEEENRRRHREGDQVFGRDSCNIIKRGTEIP